MVSGLGFKSWTILSWFLCVTEDGGFFCVWLSHFEAVPSPLCIFGSFAVIEQNYVGFSWVLCFVDLCACLYGTPAFRLQSFRETVFVSGNVSSSFTEKRTTRCCAVCRGHTAISLTWWRVCCRVHPVISHTCEKKSRKKRKRWFSLWGELCESALRIRPGAVWSRDAWRLRLCSSKWKSSDFSSVWTQIPIQLCLFICLHSCCILHFWNDYIQT